MGGGIDISLPNVSYCKDVKDVHYTPYNLVRFYVGEITGTTPQTVKIYTDSSTSVDVSVSNGNKWYSYLLPKDKRLYKIEGDSVKKVVVKVDINYHGAPFYYGTKPLIPLSTVEASFKGSNTSKVTNMESMFNKCSGLTSLDLSNFDTSNVIHMGGMFDGCRGLTSLTLSNFNTSNVTAMNSMFDGCRGLTSLDLRNFNTSNVTNMNNMFNDCSKLTSLELSGWDTSKVEAMGDMFNKCSGLTSLDLSGWDMSNVTSMYGMFNGCSNLKTITMKNCSGATRTKIQNQLKKDNITGVTFVPE